MDGVRVYSVVLATGIAVTALFIAARVRRGGLPALIVKSVASVLFIATACAALAANPGAYTYGLPLIIGLVCGLLGDIWLDLKWVYVQDRDTYLFAGIYSFMLGHFFFIPAIFAHYEWTAWTLVYSVVPAFVGVAGAVAMEKPLKLDYGRFRTISIAYGFVLMLMASSSAVAAIVTGATVWWVMSAGGVLFLFSDLVLSGTYFGQGKNTPTYVVLNHALYYAAQFSIASSILFLGRG